jgi:hypothetical protein
MVTERGSPSGIATTTTVIEIMTAASIFVNIGTSSALQPVIGPHEKKFSQPQGKTYYFSKIRRMIWANNVKAATANPRRPILSAIVSSFL